ncbi:hypothetical protein LWI29_002701 [Acer saccharum]|uniref:AAA+ ATPase domain-containing protein n=1 Tax=Acer saccharum TaxID=4024 RepID=A0AA39VKY7_ACESA|nr:hypothetical protein LWI29_002701 [Acer saccharum]
MTLLLGPPGSGKTTLMLALAGKLGDDLRTSGKVTYCGHELTEFVPQRTFAYISQLDLHYGELTVRETLDFSGRCLGVGMRYEMLAGLYRREKKKKKKKFKPDPEIDAFMKTIAVAGQKTSLVTDCVLKTLGLDICADIMVGNDMRRGISGRQKKRVTTGPAKVLLMDEISTGLDSSTTFQICNSMKQMVHVMDVTMIISLLQPVLETYDLFDEIILLSEGQVVYQGPQESVLEFFEYMGFKCPDRKGVADFLQEPLLMKSGGQVIYGGPLGHNSNKLKEYFEAIPGVAKINDGYNPATWMLEVTAPSIEAQMGVDFAEIFAKSDLYLRNQELIKELSTPAPDSKDLYFPTKYSQSFLTQCNACLWKH